jgi:pSer/pThr/pTyr-binding forkhead associated (FHA) protein
VIGRERGCDLVLADLAVSRRHAEIVRDEAGDFVLRDLGSRNQIISDGATVESVVLEPGMVVTLGGTRISIGAGE